MLRRLLVLARGCQSGCGKRWASSQKEIVEAKENKWEEKSCPNKAVDYSEKEKSKLPKSVNVTIIGANTSVGKSLALQLKQNCLIKELRLFDSEGTTGIAADLKYVNTPCKVLSFVGDNQIKYALKKTNIVMLLGGALTPPGGSTFETLVKNAPRVKSLAYACLRGAPDAVYVIAVEPINSILPLFVEVFRQNGVFSPNKVLGSVAAEVTRLRTLVAAKFGLEPGTLEVQIIGGASPETVVPVITASKPGGQYLKKYVKEITEKLRSMNEETTRAKQGVPPVLSTGYSAATFVATIAKGLCGIEHPPYPAMLRTNTIEGVQYFVTNLIFGPDGVQLNLGLPRLSKMEIKYLEDSMSSLQADIMRGECFLPVIEQFSEKSHREEVAAACC